MNDLWNTSINFLARYVTFMAFACLVLAVSISLYGISFPYLPAVIQVVLGGFIGGITNKIAIKMLFEKKWFLPGSGVLLKQHSKIVHSLARTVEMHLISSEMIEAELQKLLKPVNIAEIEKVLNNIIDEFRRDARDYLRSRDTRREIREAIKTKLGFLGKFLNVTRIKDYEEMTDAIIAELDYRLHSFRITREMVAKTIRRVGTLEEFLFAPNNDLLLRHYQSDKSFVQLLFEKIDIRNMVTNKLSTYEPSRVRDIIEENVRSHLVWLEVFGVILGMLFSGMLILGLQTLRT